METVALLTTATLFGGTVLYSFGFAAFLFKNLPAEKAGSLLRRAFPHFYTFMIVTGAIAAGLLFPSDTLGAALLATVAVTTLPARQILMPAINAATDTGQTRRFAILHGSSVALTLVHIAMIGFVLTRFL